LIFNQKVGTRDDSGVIGMSTWDSLKLLSAMVCIVGRRIKSESTPSFIYREALQQSKKKKGYLSVP
jgi:hypothetical protein